ncbi:CidA/LrgA family protein [Metabacillus sp. RGM 3146]|uniref:CidA/LrgA family protein n=1 Tax=Metabacillus sp. RGM 3146 TaxID=3401092 RepID=UPI003B9D6806
MKLLIIIAQVILINCFFLLGMLINHMSGLPIPSGIIGMILLLAALYLKIIKLKWVEMGASWLLAELLLFFVPSAVGVVQIHDLFSTLGLKFLAIIIISIIIVMGATAYTAEKLYERRMK